MFPSRGDRLLLPGLRTAALLTGGVVVLLLAFLIVEAWPGLRAVGLTRFFTDPSWHPAGEEGTFNLAPMLVGTLAAAAGALAFSSPLALGSALFCHYFAGQAQATLYRRLIEVLAGVPSVVYGFWGLVVLVPLIRRLEPPGASLFAGILVLTIMILPTLMLSADAAFAAIPEDYFKAAAALGLSRPAVIAHVVLPASRGGLATGLMLSTGRAVGETMAVLMVCGNVVQTPDSLFDPIRTLTANIALEMAYALGDHRAALFVSGLVLMGLVIALVLAAATVVREPA
ncbi:MAG: phosphate ABC transporter permease subunit PstC [Acidobacteriota bacterium]